MVYIAELHHKYSLLGKKSRPPVLNRSIPYFLQQSQCTENVLESAASVVTLEQLFEKCLVLLQHTIRGCQKGGPDQDLLAWRVLGEKLHCLYETLDSRDRVWDGKHKSSGVCRLKVSCLIDIDVMCLVDEVSNDRDSRSMLWLPRLAVVEA